MPVPYRPVPRVAGEGSAGFVDLLRDGDTVIVGLLVVDGLGRPLELIYNRLVAPTGTLWRITPEAAWLPDLIHTLFDTAQHEPDVLYLSHRLGPREACRDVLAPALPCRWYAHDGAMSWLGEPPTAAMRGAQVAAELERRGLGAEPFDRLSAALRALGNGDG